MTALSADAQVPVAASQETREFPVAAAETIYKGGFVGLDPAGYAKPFEPGDLFAGIATGTQDNSSGAAGALDVQVITLGDFYFDLTGASMDDVGKPVFATDDATLAFTGHPDAFVGRFMNYMASGEALIRMRAWGEKPPNGVGSIELAVTGHEAIAATGTTAGTFTLDAGFDGKSALGLGLLMNAAEGGGIKGAFDATAEVALASVRMTNATLPVDKGITFETDLVVSDSGDNAALDVDWGLGTALTTNSEADIDHADMAQLACFHLDGNSDNILCQSDDATTDVAPVDSTKDNDSTTDVPKKFKIVVRPDGEVQFWIDGARVLSSTTFAVLSTANLAAFVNMEKTSNDTTAEVIFRNLRVAGGCNVA